MKNNLKEILHEKGITPYELAKRIKVAVTQPYKWIKPGAMISSKNLYKIAKALNVKIDDIIS